ncbi:MAG: CsgG/HfaB family protein [Myxococcota bacterium]
MLPARPIELPGVIRAIRIIASVLAVCTALAAWPGDAGARTRPVTVAVMYFDYDGPSEEMAFLRKGLNQMLVSDLVGLAGITVVERVRLEEVLAELELNQSKKIDRKSALRAGKLLGARYIVVGGYFIFKEQMVVTVRLLDVERGAVVSSLTGRGGVDNFWDIEQDLAAKLKTAITDKILTPGAKTPTPPRAGPRRIHSRPSSKPALATGSDRRHTKKRKKLHAKVAARNGKALDAADRGDKKKARAELAAIVKDQPDFEPAQLDLASLSQ